LSIFRPSRYHPIRSKARLLDILSDSAFLSSAISHPHCVRSSLSGYFISFLFLVLSRSGVATSFSLSLSGPPTFPYCLSAYLSSFINLPQRYPIQPRSGPSTLSVSLLVPSRIHIYPTTFTQPHQVCHHIRFNIFHACHLASRFTIAVLDPLSPRHICFIIHSGLKLVLRIMIYYT
jgi:hypothetical protein